MPGMGDLSVLEEESVSRDSSRGEPGAQSPMPGEPSGGPYDWFRRAMHLLHTGNPHAALELIDRLRVVEPDAASVHQARARALFDIGQFREAGAAFEAILDRSPDDDYAHFGLGMCLWREQQFPRARDELAMAFVMRPSRAEYAQALNQVKATLRARLEAGLPLAGPVRQAGMQ